MVEGDPRRRDLAKPYEYPGHVKPEDYPPDYIALLSLMLGLVGLLMKVRTRRWICIRQALLAVEKMHFASTAGLPLYTFNQLFLVHSCCCHWVLLLFLA